MKTILASLSRIGRIKYAKENNLQLLQYLPGYLAYYDPESDQWMDRSGGLLISQEKAMAEYRPSGNLEY